MTTQKRIEEILDFAISKELNAYQFYMDLAEKFAKPHMQEVFKEFTAEERRHMSKLLKLQEDIKEERHFLPFHEKIIDLKISDYMVDVEPGPEMDYQQALIVAMKREKEAYKLYMDLSESTTNENVRNMFLFLAQEEAKHKLRFEIEYDDEVLREN